MRPARILVVDDEPQITRVMRVTLGTKGFDVRTAAEADGAMDLVRDWRPDLVITDLAMPHVSGIELCRRIRQHSPAPIIVLSVKDDERTKIEALDAGADDYVTKPFSMDELLARVRAALRRTTPGDEVPTRIVAGDFLIDVEARRVEVSGRDVHLTPKEFELLVYFARHPGKVLTHRALLERDLGQRGTRSRPSISASSSGSCARSSSPIRPSRAICAPSRGSATGSSLEGNRPYQFLRSVALCWLAGGQHRRNSTDARPDAIPIETHGSHRPRAGGVDVCARVARGISRAAGSQHRGLLPRRDHLRLAGRVGAVARAHRGARERRGASRRHRKLVALALRRHDRRGCGRRSVPGPHRPPPQRCCSSGSCSRRCRASSSDSTSRWFLFDGFGQTGLQRRVTQEDVDGDSSPCCCSAWSGSGRGSASARTPTGWCEASGCRSPRLSRWSCSARPPSWRCRIGARRSGRWWVRRRSSVRSPRGRRACHSPSSRPAPLASDSRYRDWAGARA